MTIQRNILNPVVAAFVLLAPAAAADTHGGDVPELLEQLRDPDLENWQRVERQVFREWSRSGSASADLLLQRGRDALERGDAAAAIDHFSALIDHAPDFAEGWNARATAWFMARNYGLALNDIRETLARNPHHFAALIGLGRIMEDLERHDDARRAWEAAAAIHPHRRDVKAALERLTRKLQGTSL
ncbi:tetratricopeptide repeat protein [Roseinatronobacter alkalisoli]|uniref:Tetratricopeptide repeat protein n=1 Tax=Roseinatronobacter alkalisoli TaxID=3028235 RepID=A0ABT5T319_9RHOB|nr:tetratricopeptide repeat protein [Roseinatronobacter sp. HJB301]MDD7969510.1 tetratricopeptide repeat protein [Roseinatronobacter sp. HJB301]